MSATKKLYEVRTEVVVYVLSENADQAWLDGADAIRDEVDWNGCDPDDVFEVTDRHHHLSGGWSRGTLVYGADEETTVGQALDAVPQ